MTDIKTITERYMNGAEALDGNPLAAAYRADVGWLLSHFAMQPASVVDIHRTILHELSGFRLTHQVELEDESTGLSLLDVLSPYLSQPMKPVRGR